VGLTLARFAEETESRTAPLSRPDVEAGEFASCYAREMPGLVWFVMSLGATPEVAADVAQSAFADAFPVWPAIRHPRAWLRRVAERGYYRRGSRETLVESPPERPGLLPTASAAELRDEARAVLAALATLPPKQRQVMAWCIDGYTPAEIARELGADPARASPRRATRPAQTGGRPGNSALWLASGGPPTARCELDSDRHALSRACRLSYAAPVPERLPGEALPRQSSPRRRE
jgi:RNA polymerase sigma-70 factor (ECF subfamily)